jgi:hypothetical protein
MPFGHANALDAMELRSLISAYEHEAFRRGVQHVTCRRLAEVLGIADDVEHLRDTLARTWPLQSGLLHPIRASGPSSEPVAP